MPRLAPAMLHPRPPHANSRAVGKWLLAVLYFDRKFKGLAGARSPP